MYVLKGKPKICTPHSSQTDEPRTTKIGMGHLCLNLTPSAKFGSDRFTGAGALKPPFHVDFGFFIEPPSAKLARRLFTFTWRPKVGFLAYISETVVDRRKWLAVAKLREPSPIIWSRSRPDRFRRSGWGEQNVLCVCLFVCFFVCL